MRSRTKRCPRCTKRKTLQSFFKGNCGHGRQAYCKLCAKDYGRERYQDNPEYFAEISRAWRKKNPDWARSWKLKTLYGVTLEEYHKIFEKQGKCCAVCKIKVPTKPGWCLDHNHKTGEMRGILCPKCNRGLGYLDDSAKNLKNAIEYLKAYGDATIQ